MNRTEATDVSPTHLSECEGLLNDVSRPSATFAALWVAVVGVVAYMFLPLIVGGLAEERGFSSSQLGFIGAAEAGGMGLANALAALWIRRWNWRVAILGASTVMVGANMASIGVTTFAPLFTARVIDGLAGGTLIAIGVACQSDNRNASRVFGYFIALEMFVSSVGFLILPSIRDHFGVDGLFASLALLASSALLAMVFHPSRGAERTARVSAKPRSNSPVAVWSVALLGALLFFMSQGGLWAFIERIGVASGISTYEIGRALAVSSMFGIAGALGATWLAKRYGPSTAFAGVLVGEMICIAMLYGDIHVWRYFAAVCLFIFFWSLGLPLMLTQFNGLDGAGRLVILLYAMGKLGYTLGPAVMGLLTDGTNFTTVLASSAALCAAGVGIFIALCIGTTEPRIVVLAARDEERGRL